MDTNERSIRINGSANIPQDLTNGKEYALTISAAEVRNVSEKPTDDGKINKTFTLKLSAFSEVTIISESIIKAKVKGKQSQALRRAIERVYDTSQPEGYKDKEDYYQKRMSQIIDSVNAE